MPPSDSTSTSGPAPGRTSWRDPAFLLAARTAASSRDQFERFKKIYSEPFYLLDMTAEGSGAASAPSPSPSAAGVVARMTMSGSRQTRYRMTVERSGRITCSCPDSYMNCGRLGCVCKHACFFVFRVLRLVDHLEFLSTGRLRPADVEEVARRGAPSLAPDATAAVGQAEQDAAEAADGRRSGVVMTSHGIDLLCESLSSATLGELAAASPRHRRFAPATPIRRERPSVQSLTRPPPPPPPDFSNVLRPPTEDSECPICFCGFSDVGVSQSTGVLGCPDCGNPVHLDCVSRWLAFAPHATCVICRSPAWRQYKLHI